MTTGTLAGPRQQDQPAGSHDRLNLAIFFAGNILYWASLYVYVPILSVYAERLGAPLSLIGLIVATYGFSQLALRIPIGVWSDRAGRRRPFIVGGLLVAGLGSMLPVFVAQPWALVVFRSIHGLAACVWVPFTVLFASYFPAARSVRAMGYLSFTTGLAQVLSTWSGGQIAEAWGWTAPFYVSVGLGLAGAVLLSRVREERMVRAAPPSPQEMLRVGTAPMLLVVSAIAALLQFSQFTISYGFLPVYAAQLGATRADQGNLTAAMLVPFTAALMAAAVLAERLGERRLVAFGMVLTAVSVAVLPFLGDLTLVGLAHALSGLGRGIAQPVLMGLAVRSVASTERATAMGVFQAVYAGGMTLGPALGGVVATALGLAGLFYVTGGISALGALLAVTSLRLPKPGARGNS
ncbi:MAG: MFS transporter [Chloroflexi bacterium]|nr:MFS transporter [Chloroflexota bacterium]